MLQPVKQNKQNVVKAIAQCESSHCSHVRALPCCCRAPFGHVLGQDKERSLGTWFRG